MTTRRLDELARHLEDAGEVRQVATQRFDLTRWIALQ
jgi:hypothetical protein